MPLKETVRRDQSIILPENFYLKTELGWAATSRLLRQHPIHRWFFFRHSFSPELVEAILSDWELPNGAKLLDPFVGAGTTLLTAKQKGFSAIGIDLSPLSILSTNSKVADYDIGKLKTTIEERTIFQSHSETEVALSEWTKSSYRLLKAFSREELYKFLCLRHNILILDPDIQSFFMVALLAILPVFSRAVSDGGWFRWMSWDDQSAFIESSFMNRILGMISDLENPSMNKESEGTWQAILGDARNLDKLINNQSIDGLITSPPYPNRHDYSRVFQMELLMLGKSENEITSLRHHSLRSHVEAQPPVITSHTPGYISPEILSTHLGKLGNDTDKRIPRMINGYFEDLYATLLSAIQVLKPGAKAAFVVGNVRHCGVLFPVDEILIGIGHQAGFEHYQSWVVRLRGNSAQQMGKYGREPSRETVVMLRVPNPKCG